MLERVEIHNFRSFCDFKVDLGNFSVFVGANAVGKSNFVDSFRFLRDSAKERLSVTVGRRQGFEGVRCRLLDEKQEPDVRFFLRGHPLLDKLHVKEKKYTGLRFTYELRFRRRARHYEITLEHAQLFGKANGEGELRDLSSFRRDTAKVLSEDQEVTFLAPRLKGNRMRVPAQNKDRLFLPSAFWNVGLAVTLEIEGWRIYNPDPEQARQPRMLQEVTQLTETADNLVLLLQRLSEARHRKIRTKIVETMRNLVPGFQDWNTEQLADGRLSFYITEDRIEKGLWPTLASDGTIRLLALLAALLYGRSEKPSQMTEERPSIIFVEEPERSLHPLVLGELVDLMREVSKDVQIIVTTHSPDFVRHCKPAEVFLMDKGEGITRVVPARETEQVDEFLNRFTLDQLWLMGYLEAGLP